MNVRFGLKAVIRCAAAPVGLTNVRSGLKAVVRCTAAPEGRMNDRIADIPDLYSDRPSWCFRFDADIFLASDTPHCRVKSGQW